ncbi:MAG: hypothetical protein QNK82_02225 [Akkermansiaceae bacterium]
MSHSVGFGRGKQGLDLRDAGVTHLHVGLPGANPNLPDKDVAQFKIGIGGASDGERTVRKPLKSGVMILVV